MSKTYETVELGRHLPVGAGCCVEKVEFNFARGTRKGDREVVSGVDVLNVAAGRK